MEHVINRDQIMHLVKYAPPGKLPEALIKYLADHVRITDIVLDAVQTRDDKHMAKLATMSTGLETAFNSFMSIAYDVLEPDRHASRAIDPVKTNVNRLVHENYASLAMIFKARNPLGTADGDSSLGTYFFEKFLELCATKRSTSWESIMPGMTEYIDLCLTKRMIAEEEQFND